MTRKPHPPMEKDRPASTQPIELRSGKVRHILSQRPSLIVRYGTVIITLVMAAAAAIAFKLLPAAV